VGDYAEECWNGRGGFGGDCGDMENRLPINIYKYDLCFILEYVQRFWNVIDIFRPC
jgi:hypothetical protein